MEKSESLCLTCKHYEPADDVFVTTQFQEDFNLAPPGGLCMFRNIPRPLPIVLVTNKKKEKEFIPEVTECNKYQKETSGPTIIANDVNIKTDEN